MRAAMSGARPLVLAPRACAPLLVVALALALSLCALAPSSAAAASGVSLGLGDPLRSRVSATSRTLKGSAQCDECRTQLGELRKWYDEFQAEQGAGEQGKGLQGRSGAGAEGAAGAKRSLVAEGDSTEALKAKLTQKKAELKGLQDEFTQMKIKYSKVAYDKFLLDLKLGEVGGDWEKKALTPEAMDNAHKLLDKCGLQNGMVVGKKIPVWKGYACSATDEELQSYFDYEPMKQCPDDWFLVQHLIYVRNCFALPKRRCLNRTPPTFVEPMPFPQSLFDQRALIDEDVRWSLHWCKSFQCLNTRMVGDCRNCFNMTLEAHRWQVGYRGSVTMKQVVEMKKGALRVGLDAGGGTGSFAAHMARYNVTVMTTAMNIETVVGRMKGLPYMETIALRGLVPLWVPHKGRLPFFDNTLDLIHCVNSIKYLPMLEFEELLFEWDRVLRVGGILWFEMFYAPIDEMPMYVAIIELLKYKKLYWNVTPKPDFGERKGVHVYLNCVIEKPVRKD